MMSVSFTPEALNDLYGIKEYLDTEYGTDKEKEILKKIIDDINRLTIFPNIDIKLFERFEIETDYRCIYSNRNYIVYRVERNTIRIIRVLNVKRDFMRCLFGIDMVPDTDEDYGEKNDNSRQNRIETEKTD